MKLSVSNLLPHGRAEVIGKQYRLGLEEIRFGISDVLDRLGEELEEYKKSSLWDRLSGNPFQEDTLCPESEKRLCSFGGELTLHGPFLDLCPASFDRRIAEVTKKRFEQCYEAAVQLGAKGIVFHTGFLPRIHEKNSWIRNSCMFWKDFLKDKKEEIAVYLENVQDPEPDAILQVLEAVDLPFFSACLDVGHVNCYGRQEAEQWIRVLGSRIGHVHLHNNYGISDSHGGIRQGNLDLISLVKRIRQTAPGVSFVCEISREDMLRETIEALQRAEDTKI